MRLYHYTNLDSFLKIWRNKHLLFSTSHKRTNNDIFEKQKYITIAGDAQDVQVYDAAGRLEFSGVTSSVSNLTKGIHIVKVGGAAVKVSVR